MAIVRIFHACYEDAKRFWLQNDAKNECNFIGDLHLSDGHLQLIPFIRVS